MTDSEIQTQSREDQLANLAGLYPQAFALVAESNSRAGRDLRRFERGGMDFPRQRRDQFVAGGPIG